jgi:branched-chain amino acid transport system ATP-binding protein
MLKVENLAVAYGDFQVLWGVSLSVGKGEVVCLLGPNGAGKSTILNTVSGLLTKKEGSISFDGCRIDSIPTYKIVQFGLSHVLERRRLFPYMTVQQNLVLGSYIPEARIRRAETLDWVLSLFPILRERTKQQACTLSGGEQQMLAMARGLMSRPKMLMIDEPFLGLAPNIIDVILGVIQAINQEGVSILFIEQNVQLALKVSDRGYLLESGRVVLDGTGQEMLNNEELRRVYLGM